MGIVVLPIIIRWKVGPFDPGSFPLSERTPESGYYSVLVFILNSEPTRMSGSIIGDEMGRTSMTTKRDLKRLSTFSLFFTGTSSLQTSLFTSRNLV